MATLREYKNKFTLDGRLKPQLGVTKAKVNAAKAMLEGALAGSIMDDARLRESVTTSDAMFNVAHLVSLNLIPQFDAAPRELVSAIAGTRTVPDFRPVTLYSLFGDITGPGITATGAAATVPETAPYAHVTVTGVESMYANLAKKGFKFSFSWEARVNDTTGFFDGLPSELLQVSLDTEESEVMDALLDGTTAAAKLLGGTLPDDTVVLVNAKLTPSAIWQAIIESSNRTVNGRKVGRASGYNVLVPVGVKPFIDFQIRRTVIAIQDGAITFGAGDDGALSNVTVIESDRLTGLEWYMLPKPGTTRRPVLELARLRGYESPELRVNNAVGTYAGGATVSPFEGSFDNDTIDYRFRYVAGGILWDDTYVVHSTGSGTA
jgi:hypothetical protein